MRNLDRDIVECACRLADKLRDGPYYTDNGEYSRMVKLEIARLVKHCEKKALLTPKHEQG